MRLLLRKLGFSNPYCHFLFKNRNLQEKGNAEDRIMSTTNFSSGRRRTKSFEINGKIMVIMVKLPDAL